MPRDDSARVLDMLVAARDALAFVAAMTRDEFELIAVPRLRVGL